MIKVIVHILNEEPFIAEIEELPSPTTTNLQFQKPRFRDGKTISYLERDITMVIWPMNRINFIEVLPSDEQGELDTYLGEE